MGNRYQAPTVRKAFEILDRVCRSTKGMTLSELSRVLGISKSTVLGIAQALEDRGALVRDPGTKRYSPGLDLFRLGQAARSRRELEEIARPFIEDLASRTGETVFLGVRSGSHVYILDTVESTREIKITSPVGTRLPLLAGATGKVFLSTMPPELADRMIRQGGIKRYTARTVVDPDRYLREVGRARSCGWAADDEEYLAGVRAVAAPVKTSPVSAIWVVGLAAGMNAGKVDQIALLTVEAATGISRRVEEGARCRASA